MGGPAQGLPTKGKHPAMAGVSGVGSRGQGGGASGLPLPAQRQAALLQGHPAPHRVGVGHDAEALRKQALHQVCIGGIAHTRLQQRDAEWGVLVAVCGRGGGGG